MLRKHEGKAILMLINKTAVRINPLPVNFIPSAIRKAPMTHQIPGVNTYQIVQELWLESLRRESPRQLVTPACNDFEQPCVLAFHRDPGDRITFFCWTGIGMFFISICSWISIAERSSVSNFTEKRGPMTGVVLLATMQRPGWCRPVIHQAACEQR